MRKLTEAQIEALNWLPERHPRTWGGKMFGAPSKAALKACLRRGWAARVGHPNMDLWLITEAGRSALAEERKDA